MFQTASSFNQPLTNLVNTSGVASCSLATMFNGASQFNQNIGGWTTTNVTNMSNMFNNAGIFNNGELGLQNITGLTPPTGATYTNTTRILFCPGGSFLTTLTAGDVLIIQTSTIIYSSTIQSITNDTNLVLTTAYGSNISSGITNIRKQIAGTSPLNWNTFNVTNISNMFITAPFFNQNITTNGTTWNTTKVTNASAMFQGTPTTGITLFNNGQILTGTTAPMGWIFASGAQLTSFRLNCRLTNNNKPALVT
jgi:surface protein